VHQKLGTIKEHTEPIRCDSHNDAGLLRPMQGTMKDHKG